MTLMPCLSFPPAFSLLSLTERFGSVTLVLAGDADTVETVDESLRLFGVCVLFVSCLCFGSRYQSCVARLVTGQFAWFCVFFSDRLLYVMREYRCVYNNYSCTL